MDPVSAVGIGLAVVGLTGQCFTGAMRALELISTARNLKPDYKFLTIRLQLEKQRCFNWASESGLLAYLNNEIDLEGRNANLTGLNRTAVLEVVAQIEVLVVGFIKYKGRYGSLVPDTEDHEQSMPVSGRVIEGAEAEASSPESRSDVKDFLVKAQGVFISASLPKRIRWASMDKAKYESLIDRLKALNDSLLDLMDDRIRTAIYQSTRETRLSVLQLNSKVEDLSQLIKALLPAIANQPIQFATQPAIGQTLGAIEYTRGSASAAELGRLQGSDDNQLIQLARFKAVNASIEEAASLDESIASELSIAQPSKQMQDTKLNRAHVKIADRMAAKPTSNRTEAIYQPPGQSPQRVWVEWKAFRPIDRKLNPSATILDRVQKLTALLRDPNKPASLHIPTCLGYFNDAEGKKTSTEQSNMDDDDDDDRPPECRFGFVFLEPGGSSSSAGADSSSMQSLWDILGTSPKPSLTQRIELARALASSVMSLHLVNWLHKGLRSTNILFSKEGETPVVITKPFVSGFDYARPAQKGEITEMPTLRPEHNLYRHPDAHSVDTGELKGFRKTFDIYSLGIILVEIACWERIEAVLKIKDPKKTSPRIIMNQLLTDTASIDAVEGGAGSRFATATRACLAGPTAFGLERDDDEAEDVVGAKLSKGFYEKVLRCLEEITI